jgi:signal recognition particle receptor subunit beta
MPRVFAITSSTDHVLLNADRKGEATFTVTNSSTRSIRAQIRLRPLEETKIEWLNLTGEAERDFTPGATQQVVVSVKVPGGSSGKHSFRIDVISVENPDEDYSEGPVVALRMGLPARPARPFPWWILIVVSVGLVLISALAYLLIPKKVDVPNVVQMSFADAKKKIDALGLTVKEISQESDEKEGTVIDQKPKEGKIKKGGTIELTVAVVAMVDVPSVTGQAFQQAAKEIARSGLTVVKIAKEDPAALDEMVIDQEPKEGRIKKGGAIKLTVAIPVSKAQANIILLGQKDHGKTTLASAITKVLSDIGRSTFVSYETLVNFPQKQAEFKTSRLSYKLVDFPDNDGIVNFLNDKNSKADAAILVVSAVDGPMPQTREHIKLAKEKGISAIVVFISKADLVNERDRIGSALRYAPEQLVRVMPVFWSSAAQQAAPRRTLRQLVEKEVRELLNAYGFPGTEIPVIYGSALGALQGDPRWRTSVMDLVKSIEEYVEPRLRISQ